MKAILMTRNDRARMTHDRWALYDGLPGDSRARLRGEESPRSSHQRSEELLL